MTRHLFASALFAGLATGLIAALLQFAFVIPLLLEGEAFETGQRVHAAASPPVAPQGPAGVPDIPGIGAGRHALTVAMALVTYTGFALLLVAGFALRGLRGARPPDARAGVVWGLAGFLAVQLAPAFGLPPELPGTIGAELGARQIWWVGTVGASIAGIALIAFGSGAFAPLLGAALLLLPHLVGAPRVDTYSGTAPPELAAHFATRSLGVAAVSWCVLGLAASHLWARGHASAPARYAKG